ncbi:MAG TPA: carboxypeptidase-like regulatory domain-containing protein, partial [Pyrinomonadaceae bacterium]|nr:carboxypeptidase-like regulatory domain-containing protein [Pyrinomonadaceae bacterium]
GVYHYEYAVFNQNMDRAVRAFSVPLGGAAVSNVGFHAPPQHPGWSHDGTSGNLGFSSAPWNWSSSSGSLEWSTETFAQNPNANAIRWGTMYNFRFETDRPPQTVQATIGFFKTGEPITVEVMAPSGPAMASATVSGRVLSSGGFGVSSARVTITDGNVVHTAITNGFGFYSFPTVTMGGTYTVSVTAKRYTYAPQQVVVNGNISGVDFLPSP